ncbi:DNA-processing protein DprA [Subtercola frigoramans]|uniref:DNA processing protein n=1 Tax=Subtercola frigoramans TaxID=120298 RepID=A0ABS2L0E2_9MICO|nr:DNA-processing protein DprA [Subtercola frigoramans]MBM7470538.1 DNA processing protein [Subtercola frigoramans]
MAQTNRTLVEALQHTTNTHHSANTVARIVWAGIANPGDTLAGALTQTVGHEYALEILLNSTGDFAAGIPLTHIRKVASERFSVKNAVRAINATQRKGYTLLTPERAGWPELVEGLGFAMPHALWVRGDTTLFNRGPVTVTGSRACTTYGRHVCLELASGLAQRGYTIVTGASYGIDTYAARAALALDCPTIAVLAGGVDQFYPTGNQLMLSRIAKTGALVSELPPGTPPARFQQRNRLTAALAEKTIVIEAEDTVGALSTALIAKELGRGIGAVPGMIISPQSVGCNTLIRNHGAVPITTITDADWL